MLALLFAYGLPDHLRDRVLIRNGWLKCGDNEDEFGPKAALERLRRFIFKSAPDSPGRAKPQPKSLEPARRTSHEEELQRGAIQLPGRSAPLAPHSSPA